MNQGSSIEDRMKKLEELIMPISTDNTQLNFFFKSHQSITEKQLIIITDKLVQLEDKVKSLETDITYLKQNNQNLLKSQELTNEKSEII